MKKKINKNLSVKELMKKHKISRSTAWRSKKQGYFMQKYHKINSDGVFLTEVLSEKIINRAIKDFGENLEKKLSKRKFRRKENTSYYFKCLYSLCSETKRIKKGA